MRFAVAALLASLVASAAWAQGASAPKDDPDTLEFTNGDRLSGKLLKAADGSVTFHSDMAGDLTIPFSKVKSLQTRSTFIALQAGKRGDNTPIVSGTVTVRGDQVTLSPVETTGKLAPETIPAKELGFLIDAATYAREVDHRPSLRLGWTGSASAGFTLVRATQSSTTFNGALNFVRQIPTVAYLPKNHRTTFNLTETYGTESSPVIPPTSPASAPDVVQTSIFHADAERDQYVSARFFALGDLSVDHNFAAGLQFQQIYGMGIGWTPVQNDVQQLDLKAEVHYEKQQFIQTATVAFQPNRILVGSTFQENYRRTLPHKLVLTEWANILPAWNDPQAYAANAYVALAVPVYKRMNLNLSSTDNYLNDPAEYYRTNTVQVVTGVSYTFK